MERCEIRTRSEEEEGENTPQNTFALESFIGIRISKDLSLFLKDNKNECVLHNVHKEDHVFSVQSPFRDTISDTMTSSHHQPIN